MSFSQAYRNELERLRPFYEAAVNADREFHYLVKEGSKRRSLTGQKKAESYRESLDLSRNRFLKSCQIIDDIISAALTDAKMGDQSRLPVLFAYVTFIDHYFRSGYKRGTIWRFMKKLPFDEEQCQVLRNIVLQQIEPAGPEFVEIARVVRRIDSTEFRNNIMQIAFQSRKKYILRRIQHMLDLLGSKMHENWIRRKRESKRKIKGDEVQ
jgi:hypothetical protein